MSDAGTDAGAAKLVFHPVNSVVEVDDDDNPNGRVIVTEDAGIKVSFAIGNAGSAAGAADVKIFFDGNPAKTWTSQELPPGGSENPGGDGFVHGCGRLPVPS